MNTAVVFAANIIDCPSRLTVRTKKWNEVLPVATLVEWIANDGMVGLCAVGRNLDSVTLKMFPYLIYFKIKY
jgi:hypothetical protein